MFKKLGDAVYFKNPYNGFWVRFDTENCSVVKGSLLSVKLAEKLPDYEPTELELEDLKSLGFEFK